MTPTYAQPPRAVVSTPAAGSTVPSSFPTNGTVTLNGADASSLSVAIKMTSSMGTDTTGTCRYDPNPVPPTWAGNFSGVAPGEGYTLTVTVSGGTAGPSPTAVGNLTVS